jgi:hypothetical protein
MDKKGTVVGDLCAELGITRATIYRYLFPTGELRPDGKKGSRICRDGRTIGDGTTIKVNMSVIF